MSSFSAPKQYPAIAAATSDVPASWMSNENPRVAKCTKRILAVRSQNGEQGPGGQLSFVLPSAMGSGMLASGSAYIRMTVSVTQATAYTWSFKNTGAASSIVNRMTLLASGSIAEQISYYGKMYNSLLLHASSKGYAESDDRVYQDTFDGLNTAASVEVCIPVCLGTFNAAQHLPLFLLTSAQLTVDLETILSAFTSGSADAITDYKVNNAQLVCEQILPDQGFEAGIKQRLEGRVFQMPISTFYNLRQQNSASLNQIIGLNSSSVRSVLWNVVPTETSRGAGHFTSDAQSVARLYLDGVLVSNVTLDTAPAQYAEMARALHSMFDATCTSVAPSVDTAGNAVAGDFQPGALSRALYSAGAYLGGISCGKASETGFSFQGVPVNQAVLEIVNTGTGGNIYVYVALQQIVLIRSDGAVDLMK